jgi:hypothetical protein
MVVRNTEGLKAKIRARTKQQKARIKQATATGLERVFNLAQEKCPRDTEYMALHMAQGLTRDGFNFFVGFFREDFVGQLNRQVEPPRLITEFYPDFVIRGTRFRAGNDFLMAALREDRPNLLRLYRVALAGR